MDSVGSGDALIRNQHVAQLSAKPILPLHHVPIEDDPASIPRPIMMETEVSRLFAPKIA